MPVEVMIQTAEWASFDYLTKPIRDSMRPSDRRSRGLRSRRSHSASNFGQSQL
jgi:hypothetical protein